METYIIKTLDSEYYEGLKFVPEANGEFHVFGYEKELALRLSKSDALNILNVLPKEESARCQIIKP